jgi:hypothetical protein
MNNTSNAAINTVQADEEILFDDVSDDALEAAATGIRDVFCTQVVTGCTTETNW